MSKDPKIMTLTGHVTKKGEPIVKSLKITAKEKSRIMPQDKNLNANMEIVYQMTYESILGQTRTKEVTMFVRQGDLNEHNRVENSLLEKEMSFFLAEVGI